MKEQPSIKAPPEIIRLGDPPPNPIVGAGLVFVAGLLFFFFLLLKIR